MKREIRKELFKMLSKETIYNIEKLIHNIKEKKK